MSVTQETENPHVLRRRLFISCLPVFIDTLCRRKRAKCEEELSGRPACLEGQTGKDALLQDLSSVRQAGTQAVS